MSDEQAKAITDAIWYGAAYIGFCISLAGGCIAGSV
jgi:hypothetical protein